MTDIKPCTVKGCRATTDHHHPNDDPSQPFACDDPKGCATLRWLTFGPVAAPARLTRKALNARIAELEAENADLIERGWADEKVICDLRAENADLHAVSADQAARLHALEKIGAEWDFPEVYAIEDAHGCISTRDLSWPEDSGSYERDCGPCRIVAIYKDGRD